MLFTVRAVIAKDIVEGLQGFLIWSGLHRDPEFCLPLYMSLSLSPSVPLSPSLCMCLLISVLVSPPTYLEIFMSNCPVAALFSVHLTGRCQVQVPSSLFSFKSVASQVDCRPSQLKRTLFPVTQGIHAVGRRFPSLKHRSGFPGKSADGKLTTGLSNALQVARSLSLTWPFE